MKKTKIIYWVVTSLFAAFMLMSAIPDIVSDPIAVEGMHKGLGYPLYFIPFIGWAKLLGVVAIMVPRFPRLKEWAYAGFFFDLAGATYSIIAVGSPAANWLFMVIPFAFWGASYYFYQKKRMQSSISMRPVFGDDRIVING